MAKFSSDPNDKLLQRLKDGTLHHAILFHGHDLESVEGHALSLAKQILHMNEEASEHPDLFRVRPAGKTRIISIDKTRELIAELNRTSNQGGAKVGLLHESDRMKMEASNAFLKTLEEPPHETFLFLLTTRPYSMLPTIRSRCLQVRIATNKDPIDDKDWDEWVAKYGDWIHLMLDRKRMMQDRTAPVFAAYGLAERLTSLIRRRADEKFKAAIKELTVKLDHKEKDALESGIRRGIRSGFLTELALKTREIVIRDGTQPTEKISLKLARAITSLEKNKGLMEVNLKEEAALENFLLFSLRNWTAK